MKNYTIKNYKGNILESLKKFQSSHKKMRIVEAVEDEEELKIKAVEEALSDADQELSDGIETFFDEEVASGALYDSEFESNKELHILEKDPFENKKTVNACKQYLKDECGIDVFRSEEAYDDFIYDKLQELAKDYLHR